jgi:hypothetical protein
MYQKAILVKVRGKEALVKLAALVRIGTGDYWVTMM